jgi:hypothetical protein
MVPELIYSAVYYASCLLNSSLSLPPLPHQPPSLFPRECYVWRPQEGDYILIRRECRLYSAPARLSHAVNAKETKRPETKCPGRANLSWLILWINKSWNQVFWDTRPLNHSSFTLWHCKHSVSKIFPEMNTVRPSSQFLHSCICVQFTYSHNQSVYFFAAK